MPASQTQKVGTIETPAEYTDRIRAELNNCLLETSLPGAGKYTGKVRDRYDLGDRLALITTDRQSAFDRVLGTLPFKGQILNQLAGWWMESTRDVAPNHLISVPDPSVTEATSWSR